MDTAVKAAASVTISYMVDIKLVTRYYLLQSSTLAAPEKPTNNPPSAGDWSTTEPSYVEGSTNTLYFVDCTEYTDDTFSYSEVSKSSSYEAAKSAYDKADAVEKRVISAETSIEQNKEAIELRATKTEMSDRLDGLDSKIDEGLDNVNASIDGTNENLNDLTETISKRFIFTTDGLEITSGENTLKLVIDNDKISFWQGNEEKSYWDGNDFHIGNIKVDVTQRAQFGNFAYVPRADGSLMFLKVNDT